MKNNLSCEIRGKYHGKAPQRDGAKKKKKSIKNIKKKIKYKNSLTVRRSAFEHFGDTVQKGQSECNAVKLKLRRDG